MRKLYTLLTFAFLLIILTSTNSFSQTAIYDDFSEKALPNWVWGGMDMKYSHEEDNRENGFAELFSEKIVEPGVYIGNIAKHKAFLFTAGNFLNVMLQGVSNDCEVTISIIYDLDNNNRYDEDKDVLLVSEPFSLDFDGWKEVKIKLDEDNFEIVSKKSRDMSITESEAFGLRFDYEAGPEYKSSKFESGIALISEIENNENNVSLRTDKIKRSESYFKAKNYPNPFNPNTTISFTLPEAMNVNLAVYDRLGREVQVLLDDNLPAGSHSVEFVAEGLPSGIYFYRIKTSVETEVMKMILTK